MAAVTPGLARRLARLPVVRAEVRRVAQDILDRARARAAEHRDTGAYARSLRLVRGRVDVLVVADDPAAVSIEYGHTTPDGRPVPGLHLLGGAVADLGGSGRHRS